MKMINRLWIVLLLLGWVPLLLSQISVEVAFPNLTFTRPVDIQSPRDGSNRIFVVEQAGKIFVFPNRKEVINRQLFLDITDRVNDRGNEEGLLGLAFHPNFKQNGYFFVDYTADNPRRTVIARYQVDPNDPDKADKNSEVVILEVNQPYSNHNGGQITFGPDGYLYIALGDGGSGGDPQGNGQNRQTLLGSILRIDVDNPAPGKNYGIPPDNPFVGNSAGYREEIYAYGLRNPWRFSFDPITGWLWTADVGQDKYEEIDIIEKGGNYGWNIMEGLHCFDPPSNCDPSGLILPIWEYDHDAGRSITGGFVYRGVSVPELVGQYIYADFVSGRIWALQYDGTNPAQNKLLQDTDLLIASFGVDENNELYIAAFDGKIYRFKPTITRIPDRGQLPGELELYPNFPNPFNSETTLSFRLKNSTEIQLKILDTTGKTVRRLVQRRLPPGIHSVKWNGTNAKGSPVSTGIYYSQLTGGGETLFRKLLLLR